MRSSTTNPAERRLRVALVAMFAAHAAVTGVALWQDGLLAPFPPFRDWTAAQLFSDLLCASSLVLLFVAIELRRQRRALWPAALLGVGIVLLGSLAVLLFLLLDRRLLPQMLARAASKSVPPSNGATPD
jgi:uncharacterized membrane protein YgdD (TMEM256/DUF423 family)